MSCADSGLLILVELHPGVGFYAPAAKPIDESAPPNPAFPSPRAEVDSLVQQVRTSAQRCAGGAQQSQLSRGCLEQAGDKNVRGMTMRLPPHVWGPGGGRAVDVGSREQAQDLQPLLTVQARAAAAPRRSPGSTRVASRRRGEPSMWAQVRPGFPRGTPLRTA